MIYILDENMKIISAENPLENIQTLELPEDKSLIKNYVHVSIKINEPVTEKARFIAMEAKGGSVKAFELFEIISEETGNKSTDFVAIDIGVRETSGYVVKDFRPSDRTIRYVAEKILEETDWRVGYVDSNLKQITTNFYYLSIKDSLVKLQQVANCEIIFRVELSDNEVTDKWIEIHEQIGRRKAHRFEYGTSALEIVRQSSTADLFTALIGRGKGEESGDGYGRKITFVDVEAEDKPLGQDYIENELATIIYGIKTMNGMIRRTGIVEFDTEDREELLNLTRDALDSVSRPKTEFKTTVAKIGDADIGDSATIHKYEIGMHYETRIRKVVRDRVNEKNTDLVLGDYVHNSATKKQANVNSTIKNIEINQDEQREIIGNVIQKADGLATITYGELEPDKKRVGDLWYRPDPEDATTWEVVIWNGTIWKKTTDTEKLKADIKKAQKDVIKAQKKANEVSKEISDSIEGTGFLKLSDLIASKIEVDDASTLFFQNAKDIGLVYEENGIMKAMIGIVDGNIYQQGNKIMFKGDDIIADGTLTVTEDMFAEGITFDWAKGQTLDVNDITLVNLNMKNIAGGNIELSEGFKITNNGHEILSIDAQTGKVIFDVAGIPTTKDLEDAINAIELKAGPSGKTAYEIAVENGFVGTEQEWINSLIGEKGVNGKTAYEIAVENGFVGSKQEWLNSLNGADGKDGKDGVGISEVVEYYLATNLDSGITNANTSFTTTFQKMTSTKRYLWNYELIKYTNGTSKKTNAVLIGVFGEKGEGGSPGVDGRSIIGIEEKYLATSLGSGVTRATSGFTSGMQTPTPTEKYLWNYEIITWNKIPTETYTNPVIIGVHGEKGVKGDDGVDGRSITGVNVKYYLSNSATSLVGGTWQDNAPTMSAGKYMWSKQITKYSTGSDTETDPVMITGFKGDKGTSGDDGRGVIKIEEQFALSDDKTNPPSQSSSAWKSEIVDFDLGQYVWVRNKITYNKAPTVEYTDPTFNATWEKLDEKINTKADNETVDNIDERLSGTESMTEIHSEELQTVEQSLQEYREMLEANVVDAETALAEIDTLIQRDVAIQENLGNLTREMNFVNTQILYGDEGMYIQHIDKETGSSGNTGIRITDHSIDFMDGDKRVAYITGQVLYINHGIFVESAKIGEHLIETINGQTIFTWIE